MSPSTDLNLTPHSDGTAGSPPASRVQPVGREQLQQTDPMLGLIWFGPAAPDLPADLPCLPVPMTLLGHQADGLGELWRGTPTLGGQHDGIVYRADAHMLFGVLQLDETDFMPGESTALQQASETAYARLFALLRKTGYTHLWRTWNYVARINAEQDGLERYRQFNIGRQSAFETNALPADTTAPAACALGTVGGPLTIGFVAGRSAPLLLENPRQVSAYRYPSEYGPRSPTFSRAALARWQDDSGDQAILFISGTASIVGHRSVHLGDVRAQTRETLTNIAALLEEAERRAPRTGRFDLSQLHYRVYVRYPEDVAAIREEIARAAGSCIDAVYVQADVCRQDLLVEIEATAVTAN